MRIYAPALALLFLLPVIVRAQSASGDPLANLDFDAGEAGKLPPDWFVVPNWTVAEVRRGPECRNGGCFITMTRPDPLPPNSFGNVMRTLPGKGHAGKRIVYRAAVRVEGDGTAAMWLRVDRPNRRTGLFDNMGSRPILAGG